MLSSRLEFFTVLTEHIAATLRHDYAESLDQSDGVIVIARNGTLLFLDTGAERIFECEAKNTLTLKGLIADDQWIAKKYEQIDRCLSHGSIDLFTPDIRYVKCRKISGEEISLAIELCPIRLAPTRAGTYLAGFISIEPETAIAIQISATRESQSVINDARLRDGFAAYDHAQSRLERLYRGLAYEVLEGVPGAKIIAAITVGGAATMIAALAAYACVLIFTGSTHHRITPTPTPTLGQ